MLKMHHQETRGLYIFLHMDIRMCIFLFYNYVFMAVGLDHT